MFYKDADADTLKEGMQELRPSKRRRVYSFMELDNEEVNENDVIRN